MDEQGARVLGLAKSGDIQGAISAGEDAINRGSVDPGLTLFIGMLCCREGDFPRGISYLRRAVELAPHEKAAKAELARALLAAGEVDDAENLAGQHASLERPEGREMARIRAHALVRSNRVDDAVPVFERLIEADSADFESWGALGVARLAQDDVAGAISALERATRLRPSATTHWINLARAYGAAEDYSAAVTAARRAISLDAKDSRAHLELARALASVDQDEKALAELALARAAAEDDAELLNEIGDIEFGCAAFTEAEQDYRAALAVEPTLERSWHALAKLLERTNRGDELFSLLDDAQSAGIDDANMSLVRAHALRSEGRLEEALAAARNTPDGIDDVDRAQVIGTVSDRLGDAEVAFSAFTEANQLLAAKSGDAAKDAEEYLGTFERMRAVVTPQWYAGWPTRKAPASHASPLFIFGFPRSGTTLIDTMLSGHSDTIVLEEEPTIDRTAEKVGPLERLPNLSEVELEELRSFYFNEVESIAPGAGARRIVDKNPLGLSSTPILHRLFPEAHYVFVERHPCDVVLSCFIMSAKLNAKVASFFDFAATARLYDAVLRYWERCCEVLSLQVHRVRYERLIVDPENELRTLADFASLSWQPQLLENQANAAARSYIGSPSYSQVAEPIYTRARGRWLRYRDQMEAVLPILQPWIERMGYEDGRSASS